MYNQKLSKFLDDIKYSKNTKVKFSSALSLTLDSIDLLSFGVLFSCSFVAKAAGFRFGDWNEQNVHTVHLVYERISLEYFRLQLKNRVASSKT